MTPLLDDTAAFRLPANRPFRWVYDRLAVADTQEYEAGLGSPDTLPCVQKPVINLLGMAHGATFEPEPFCCGPGNMWCEFLHGRHVSTDMLVDCGQTRWLAQAEGFPAKEFGRFELWALLPEPYSEESKAVQDWVHAHLGQYSGPVNVETIGGSITEVHLRLSADWVRAGCYGDFSAPPVPAIGVPLFNRVPTGAIERLAHVCRIQEGGGRVAFVVTPGTK